MSLDRFKTAQAAPHAGFAAALAELRAGRKTSHWIWYIFPQIEGLGQSSMARRYGIQGLEEACDYLSDPELRDRLTLSTSVVAAQLGQGIPLTKLMGSSIDSVKLVSCLTLFQLAARKLAGNDALRFLGEFADLCETILVAAERQGVPRCHATLTRHDLAGGR